MVGVCISTWHSLDLLLSFSGNRRKGKDEWPLQDFVNSWMD